jgi:hypothetical protein
MMVGRDCRISSMNGCVSPTCTTTNFRRHFCAIFRNVSTAMSCGTGKHPYSSNRNRYKYSYRYEYRYRHRHRKAAMGIPERPGGARA